MEITPRNARQWSRLGPRAVYGMTLLELVQKTDKVYALSADLGVSSGLQRLINTYPERYLNVGIAEQNLIGVSAGLAKEGMIPFASSFAPFITLRCADQVRMNMGYMHLDIKTVGLGSGISMSGLGNSHYGMEDIAFMRSIPGMTILSPADCGQLAKAVYASAQYKGPVYIRLTGEAGMPIVYDSEFEYVIGKAITLREGEDVAFIATGSMVAVALQAADNLENNGIKCTVVDMHTIKPLDVHAIEDAAEKTKLVVSLEEHSIVGGLGAAVAQVLANHGRHAKLLTLGLPDEYLKAGSYQFMLEEYGLTADQVAAQIKVVYSAL